MRKSAIRLILLLAGAGLNATRAYAQGEGPEFDFAVGGGVILTFGIWRVGDVDTPGWQGTAAVRLLPQSLPVGFQVEGSFGRVPAQGEDDIQAQLVYGTGNVVYRFRTSEAAKFRPYLIGGFGVYHLDAAGDDAVLIGNPDPETKLGVNGGVGFDLKAGSAGLFVEARFHEVFIEGGDTSFVPITVGIRFGGGT